MLYSLLLLFVCCFINSCLNVVFFFSMMDNHFSSSVAIPCFPHFCNLIVYPAAELHGESSFHILKKTAAVPKGSGKRLLVEYLPGSIYCLLPSSQRHQGKVSVYTSRPDFLKEYSFSLEVNKQSICFLNTSSEFTVSPNLPSTQETKANDSSSCPSCFLSHFPRPNRKLCKIGKKGRACNKSLGKLCPVRLRGGAKIDGVEELPDIIERAIGNAKAHGINIHVGVRNLANGNCAFETVIDSINTRDSFSDIFDDTPDFWRNIWMSEVENVAYEEWNGGLSKDQWKDGWEVLKESGTRCW